jgi:hypothetical protein
MTTAQRFRFYELLKKLGQNVFDEEFKYFKEWARKFPSALKNRRYGILPIGTEPKDENFIFSHDIVELRLFHLEHVSKNGMSEGHKVRMHIDWLEKIEGKA